MWLFQTIFFFRIYSAGTLSEPVGSYAGKLFENLAVIALVVKANHGANLGNGCGAGKEKIFALFNSNAVEGFLETYAHFVLKNSGEICGGVANKGGGFLKGELPGVVDNHVFLNLVHSIGMLNIHHVENMAHEAAECSCQPVGQILLISKGTHILHISVAQLENLP